MLNDIFYKINRKKMQCMGWIKSHKEPIVCPNNPIDFVVTWVDNNDLIWREVKDDYLRDYVLQGNKDNGEERYRDWELFKYWFRAVEQFAPWVNNVYLVTYGHIPMWLNTNNAKLKIVKHAEFIPKKYLPTFSSIPIELNLHRIDGLSDNFVYFNDDIILSKPVNPYDFFQNNQPKYCAIAKPIKNDIENGSFQHQLFSVIGMINGYFYPRISELIKNNSEKWFSYCYGKNIKYNLRAYDENYIQGLYFSHLGVPFKKETFRKVWEVFEKELDETCTHKFRMHQDIMHQIFSAWDILKGDFVSVSSTYYGKVFSNLSVQIEEIREALISKKYKMICLNDSKYISHDEYVITKKRIIKIMEELFPEKSKYEI